MGLEDQEDLILDGEQAVPEVTPDVQAGTGPISVPNLDTNSLSPTPTIHVPTAPSPETPMATTSGTTPRLSATRQVVQDLMRDYFPADAAHGFKDQWRYNFEILLGPFSTVFNDATLTYQDIAWGYRLEYNPNGILWRVNAAGIPHPDDYYSYLEQNRIIEEATNKTIAEEQTSRPPTASSDAPPVNTESASPKTNINNNYIVSDSDRIADEKIRALDTVVKNAKVTGGGFAYNWTGPCVTHEFKTKVLQISNDLLLKPDDLMAIMAFESGFDSTAVNKVSDATGLIQFMPFTAKDLGTSTEELQNMSAMDQLDYVKAYFAKRIKEYGPINNLGDAYMAVLWPPGIGKPDSWVLWREGSIEYESNKGLDGEKKGYITRGDAVQYVTNNMKYYIKP